MHSTTMFQRWLLFAGVSMVASVMSASAALARPTPSEGVAPPEPTPLPHAVESSVAVELPVPGDKPVLVLHAPPEQRRAIVYLHGMCGDVHAMESWKHAALAHGTLIGLVGERRCGGGRFKWGKNLDAIQWRIDRAVDAVRTARGGLLDSGDLVLFGYSQGADRAEALVRRFPDRYHRVVLGGPSRRPKLQALGSADAIAVFGGEFETTGHMRAGAEQLAAAGKSVRFFLLPRAKHGEYGPEGNRVMTELLGWLLTGAMQSEDSG